MLGLCSPTMGKVFFCGRFAPSALGFDSSSFDQCLRLESADEPTCDAFSTNPPLDCF